MQAFWLLLFFAGQGLAQRSYFQFDTRSGDYQYGPDGSVQYTGASAMPSSFGTVTVSSGTTTVNGQTIPRGMQIWTVGTTGWYDVMAAGASGADALKQTGSFYGGRGVAVRSKYFLTAGTRVAIAVGMKPTGCSSSGLYGAGGGSFVTVYAATGSFSTSGQHTLILAAGGGGSVGNNLGVDASTTTTGNKCRANPATAAATAGGGGGGGAAAGGAGAIGSSTNSAGSGAGGGGFLADGGDGYYSVANQETKGGKSFLGGGAGGFTIGPRDATACSVTGITSPGVVDPPGGFGGGGGGWNAGGGGGGYSGGQACGSGDRQGGGGGGSYDWTGPSNAAGLYTYWNTNVFGTAPTGYSSGFMSSDGMVAVSTTICAAGTYQTPVVSGTLAFTTNGVHPSCSIVDAYLDSGNSGGWCATTQSVNLYYLILDAGSVGPIGSLITQGRGSNSQWVTAYDLSYSSDSTNWFFFGNLVGNTDMTTKATRPLNVVARYLRLTPTAYSGWPSMRAGYGGSLVFTTNGVHTSCSLADAYLDSGNTGGWCAPTLSVNLYYLILDAGSVGLIDSLTTQGRGSNSQWVTAYDLSYSSDSTNWVFFGNLVGNTDMTTKVTRTLNVTARYLRLTPTAYYGHPSMRAGYTASTNAVCQSCPLGTFSLQNLQATACTACEAGKYGSSTGLSGCTLCPAGTFSLISSQILASACQSCPNNSTSNSTRTGCVANTGFYNLDANLLAYYPFRPENIYADASYSGYGLINTNGASFKPQTEYNTAPFQGAGVAYFNNAGAGMSGVTVTSATGSEVQSFQVPATAWTLASYVGTSSAPGAGFSWCYWIRGADGSTAGTLNTVQYPFVSWLGTCFCNAANAAFSGFYDGRNSADANGGGGTNYWIKGVAKSGVAPSGVYTRYWQHVCFTWQGTTFRAYVNCASSTCSASASTTLAAEVFSDTLTNVYIGQGGYGTAWFGWLSDFRYYKKALTPAEVFAVRSYAGATSFSVNGDSSLLAYYPFKSSNIYADASGNGYNLVATNAAYPPASDSSTAPFAGAGVVLLDNNNVLGLASTARSFTITMGAGMNLGAMFGTQSTPNPGFSFCGWYRAKDGSTAGTVNAVNQFQTLIAILSHPANTSPSQNILRYFSVYRYGVSTGMTTAVRFNDPAITPESTQTTDGKYQNVWTHYCAAGYGRTINIYFDCGSRTCVPTVLSLSNDVYNMQYQYGYIGADFDPPWYGWLSEFRLYKRALTAAEVFAIKSYDGTNPTGVNSVNAGLLAYYPFQPNAFLVDASGVTGSLTNTGSVVSQPGSQTDLQNVAYFSQPGGLGNSNANKQFLTIPSITIGSFFSICVWYNPDSTSGSYPRLIELNSGQSSGQIQIRRDATNNNLAIELWNSNTNIVSGSTAIFTGLFQLGVWQHVCLTVAQTTGSVYYNGALQAATITLTAYKAVTTYTTSYIGQNPYTNDLYRGQLDELRIYSRAISASEVTSIYNFRGDTYTPAIILACSNPCGAGTYGVCTASGAQSCTSCPAGTYSTGTGMTTSGGCVSCQAGSYATATGVTACTNCSANSWSTGGTSTCTANLGYYNLDDSTNLKAYYTFNPGALLQDVTGTTGSLTASASSPTAQASGPFGASSNSAFMTGSASTSPSSNQYFSVPSLTLPDSVSICSWFWISPSITRNWNRIWDFGNGASSSNVLGAIYYNTNNFGVDVYRGSTSIGNRGVTNGALETSTWKHACMTLSGTSQVVWINGVSTSYTMTNTRDPSVQLTVNYLGRSNWAADLYWYGAIDEFRIYYKALTSTEVAALYAFRGDTYVPMIILACPNPCGAGTYGGCTSGGAATCTDCPAGTYSTESGLLTLAECVSCPAGTYDFSSGGTACTYCLPGTYSSTVGTTRFQPCITCSAGSFSSAEGSTTCTPCTSCVPGKYIVSVCGGIRDSVCSDCRSNFSAAKYFPSFLPATVLSTITSATFLGQSVYKESVYVNPNVVFYGGGTYEFYQSTYYSSSYPTRLLFNAIQTEVGGYWANNQYTSGTYNSQNHFIVNDYFGDWVVIKLPLPVILAKFRFDRSSELLEPRAPGALKCYGSRDGVNFFEIAAASQTTKVDSYTFGSYTRIVTPQPVVAYQYYGWTVNQLLGSDSVLNFGDLALWGQEPPTYSSTSDTSACLSCTTCDQGQVLYSACTTTSNGVCQGCQAGFYYAGGSCVACPAGTYSDTTGASSSAVCTNCFAGTYSDTAAASSSGACAGCPAGTYSGTTGVSSSSSCTSCPAGKYSDTTGASLSSACTNCPAGTYSGATGLSSSSLCTNCQAGTYSGTTGASLSSVCTHCPAGTYSGTAAASSSAVCTACPAGTYSGTLGLSASSLCTSCSAGTYSGTTGASLSSVCILCAAGTYSGTAGASLSSTCTACAAGTYSVSAGASLASTCTACAAGTYSVSAGASLSSTCQLCTAGSYSPVVGATIASTCQSCQAGTFQTGTGMDSSLACTACGAGFYSTGVGMQSSLACITCSAGTYQTGTGMQASVSCNSCSAGQYSTASGASLASTCQLCSAGTYFTGTGLQASASCSSCLAGQYSTASGATIASTCQLCSTGTFSTAIGASSVITCTACAAGTYANTAGNTICTSCSSGLGACAAGTFPRCWANASFFSCCGPKQFFRENTDTACQTCTLGGTGGDGSGTACTSCTYGLVTVTGATTYSDVLNSRVYQFKASGSAVFSRTMNADVLLVGGGGAGGSAIGGGGGAGTLIFASSTTFPGTSHTVTVGTGGVKGSNNVRGGSGVASSIGTLFSAAGGGGGGAWSNSLATNGGSGGGGGACGGCSSTPGSVATTSIVFGISGIATSSNAFAFSGGSGSTINAGTAEINNRLHGAGGGGAGAVGGNEVAGTSSCSSSNVAACGNCGAGGNGVSGVSISSQLFDFASVFGTAYTGVASSGFIAGGGGGGAFGSFTYPSNTCSGGAGGGGNGYRGTNRASSDNGLANTGSGGGGGADNSPGGNGGTGLVLLRVAVGTCVCGSGTFIATDGCASCAAGTYGTGNGFSSCVACASGKYNTGTGMGLLENCTDCPAGTYSGGTGVSSSASCALCSAGSYSGTTGSTSIATCTACSAGYYATGSGLTMASVCQACAAGTYGLTAGLTVCTSCSAGTYSVGTAASLASTCQLCPAGTYSGTVGASLSSVCLSCVAGTYQTGTGLTLVSACTACSAGYFSTGSGFTGVDSCQNCIAGTYGLTTGLSVCTSCSAGTFSVNVGASLASTCQLCQAGTFQTGLGMQSSLACMTCSAGSYATGSGMTTSGACINCPAGSYSTGVGMPTSGACTGCLAGSYSTMTGVTACTNCLANSWSTGGTSKCTANLGYYNLDDSTNLKAYYTFNPGALLQDVTGTTGSLTASASSPTSQASGPFGANSNSAFMTGSASTSPSSNQYFTLPSLTLPDSLSICSWFWISPSITRNYNRIWDFGNGATSSNIFTSVYSTSNDLYSNVYRAATIIGPARLTNGAVANVWTHVCLTLSGTSEVVWLNGVSTSFTMTNTRDSSVQLKLNYLGRSNWNTNLFWYGAIDEFRIYYKTLTSTEIAALYAFRGDTYVPMIILACPNPCTAGSYGGCTASGAQSCTVCLAGSYSTGVGMLTSDTCTSCAAGTFKSTTAASACDLCPAGKYSAAVGAATDPCLSCSAGTYSTGSGVTVSSVCLLCGAGTYSVTLAASSSGTCQSCQAGTFQTGTGMQSSLACTACDAGYYATGIGLALASNCTACTAGTYGLTAGLTICTSCSAGTYSEATAATLDSTCQLCPAGTYSGEVGASLSSTCLSCSAGYYSTGSGLTTASVCQACTVCVPGQYRTVVCTAARNSECTDCQAVISSARNYPPVATNLSNSMAITTFLQQSAYKEVRNINADSVSWGSGTYEFYQSTVYGVSYPTSLLFNGIRTETIGGHWATNQYTSGTYNSQNHYIINDYFGDWVIIKLPLPVILTKFIFYRRDANLERRSPGAWKCYGSRDGVIFFEVAAASQTTKVTSYSSGSYTKIVTPQPVVAYQYYGWVVNKFLGSDNVLNFGELEFWAQEPPTYSTTTDASVCTSCTTCGEGETVVSACNTTSNAVCQKCQAGTYSQQGNCIACASGSYSSSTGASSSASCTACSAGTYSTASGAPGSDTCVACAVGTYMTEQGGTGCTACPASSTTITTGMAQRGDCICNAGFFGNLTDLSQNCTACPANSFCAGLSQTACPVHTHSPAQSSLPIQCRCDAGYKCSYRRDASVTIRFDGMDTTQFTSQSDSIKAKLASTADVPVGNVSLVYVTQILYVPPPPPPPSSANM